MADSKRMSGRQGVAGPAAPTSGTSGRTQATTSASGRHAPQNGANPASKSSRTQIPAAAPAPASQSSKTHMQPATKSTRTQLPPASRQMAPATSGRASARSTMQSARPSARQPIGGPAAVRGGAPKPKKQRGGPEVLIAFGILAAMGLLALIIYFVKSGEQQKGINAIAQQNEIFEKNLKRAKDACEVAYNAGKLYVQGKEDPAQPEDKLREKLFGTLQRDPQIYNVIYVRSYKDRHSKVRVEQKQMNDERLRFEKMESVGREEEGIHMTYALAENKTLPVVMALKNEKGEETDKANMGGSITVIVKGDMDLKFEGGMKFKPPPPEAKPDDKK